MTSKYVGPLAAAALLALLGCGGAGGRPAGPEPGQAGTSPAARPGDDATAAVASLPASGMTTSGGTGVAQLLRGRVAGLDVLEQPDGSVRFRIRGMSTAGEGADAPQPLFLVNGVPVEAVSLANALAGLTRDDIQRVDVLKDVASTSVYGMRAAGGVVIITTRRR